MFTRLTVRPGGLVFGKSLGTKPNKVVAKLTDWDGTPRAPISLNINEWHDKFIMVEWPPDITGVKGQTATLKVTAWSGLVSNEWPVIFVPNPETKILPASDVTIVQCGTDSDADLCNNWTDPDDEGTFFLGPPENPPSYTYFGSHLLSWFCPFCSSSWG